MNRWLLRLVPSASAGPLFLIPTSRLAHAATYYVAPSGSDANPGTLAAPFATVAKGQVIAAPGDIIYFRGGTYAFTAAATTCASSTSTINGVLLDKSGASGNRINYWAYPGEVPIFDFAGIKDGCRIAGFHVKGNSERSAKRGVLLLLLAGMAHGRPMRRRRSIVGKN